MKSWRGFCSGFSCALYGEQEKPYLLLERGTLFAGEEGEAGGALQQNDDVFLGVFFIFYFYYYNMGV
jgi:hypothetical protein